MTLQRRDVLRLGGAACGESDFAANVQSQCAGLSPYLSGDAARDYPNLAAIPGYAFGAPNGWTLDRTANLAAIVRWTSTKPP
jgi:hypothetical protein